MATPAESQSDKHELRELKKFTELTESELEERKLLASFVSNMCKCVLQTSLYTRDHPQARAGVDLTFQAMEAISDSSDQVSALLERFAAAVVAARRRVPCHREFHHPTMRLSPCVSSFPRSHEKIDLDIGTQSITLPIHRPPSTPRTRSLLPAASAARAAAAG